MSNPKLRFRINQSGTSAPTLDIPTGANETGATFTPAYVSVGNYTIDSSKEFSDIFTLNNNTYFYSGTDGQQYVIQISMASTTQLGISVQSMTGTPTDGVINNVPLEIEFIGMAVIKTIPFNTSDSAPTATDIPDGTFAGWINTTTGYITIVGNIGGDLNCYMAFQADGAQTFSGGDHPKKAPPVG